MNKTRDQNPTARPAKPGDPTQPAKHAPTSPGRPQDPRETAPDIDEEANTGKPYMPGSGKDDPKPLHAARGNDEVMSQQPGKRT